MHSLGQRLKALNYLSECDWVGIHESVIVSGCTAQFESGSTICKIAKPMLQRLTIPGVFVTGTDTGVGKTVVAGAIANWFARRHKKVAVCKLAATGCVRRREGLVSEDAEFLAACADARHPLDLIAPQRFAEPLAPAIAAERANRSLDWFMINNSIRLMSQTSDLMVIEGVGGLMTPMDSKTTILDTITALGVPAVVVARPGLGTINHTLLTINTLRAANVQVAGVVVNRYPTDLVGVAEETNPRAIERWGKIPVLCIVPDEPIEGCELPKGVVSAIETVDWDSIITHNQQNDTDCAKKTHIG
ncbi:MAG TPA: dethiobiotin synthase [Tepidisphaeraceae bacterium]|nr:dethiobiotin synthase [Tepidisphaeraceae bacterium]